VALNGDRWFTVVFAFECCHIHGSNFTVKLVVGSPTSCAATLRMSICVSLEAVLLGFEIVRVLVGLGGAVFRSSGAGPHPLVIEHGGRRGPATLVGLGADEEVEKLADLHCPKIIGIDACRMRRDP
jgi:hypothetical protein